MLIYKILRDAEWAELTDAGETPGAPVDRADGYVHFSTADQVLETAAKWFATDGDLWLLAVEADGLMGLKWEPSRGGALFPHLYRTLRMGDVAWVRPLPWHLSAHVFPEEISGHVDPERAQFDAFKALDRDHPIDMLNLVRLRARSAYPTGQAPDGDRSGAAAYARYGTGAGPVFARVGGRIVWRGTFQATVIGPASERWDHAFVARYPSAHAFLEMVTDATYQKAVVHRQAAVRTSRLIRCAPAEPGDSFG